MRTGIPESSINAALRLGPPTVEKKCANVNGIEPMTAYRLSCTLFYSSPARTEGVAKAVRKDPRVPYRAC